VRQAENEEEENQGEKACQQPPEDKIMRSIFNSFHSCFDGAILPGNTKNKKVTAFFVLSVAFLFFALVGYAHAETAAPGWELTANTIPTNLPLGGKGFVEINLYNVGAASSSGVVTVTDVLPAGLTATEAYGVNAAGVPESSGLEEETHIWDCVVTENRTVTCAVTSPLPPGSSYKFVSGLGEVTRRPYRLAIPVTVTSAASGIESNRVTVVGGGALAPASTSDPIDFTSALPGFGFASFDGWFSNADGTPDTQAGSHPYALTINFNMNDYAGNPNRERNLAVGVPPGLVGDPTAVPRCPRQVFDDDECPVSTQIGIDIPILGQIPRLGLTPVLPVYNIVPPKGIPAQFGFVLFGINTFLDAGVRTGGDNGITEHVDNLLENKDVEGNSITLWGVPAEASHDNERCVSNETGHGKEGTGCHGFGASSSAEPKPFLTLPTSCGEPPKFTIEANSWQEPENVKKDEFHMHDQEGNEEGNDIGFTGCAKLSHFSPQVSIAPDTSFSDTPAGLGVELRMPPDANPEGLATSGLKNTTVTLPEGVAINPGQATGLQACQPAEEGLGDEPDGEVKEGPASCPAASKVGTDEIETPLLKEKLQGSVYVLQQNPPNLQLLVTASGEGVNLKLLGNVHLNEQTGQLTTTFENTPDLPFTTFKLNFSGGAQAALATPVDCGNYASSALFAPWASLVSSFPTSSAFQIARGPGGGPCPATPLPFAPALTAGATTDQAGGFTGFSLLLQSGDGQQRIDKLQFKAPQGLSGMISSVPLCGEAQANAGTCSASSQIGHETDAAGPGPFPFVTPEAGQPPDPIYLTGPYKGAPFGLSVVVPAVAGPFNLGTVVVRAKIEVDPRTAQITVTTDPLPQILDGVPLDLRTVDAVIDRPGFMFNPTNCNPQEFSGTATGTPPPGAGGPGATAAISSHFQVGSCQSLKFEPKFTASTSGRTSKADGASLTLKVARTTGPDSQQANFTEAKIELPKQLPSRLTTLQRACVAKVFEANPAACPPESDIGHVKVNTPVLPVPLEGPAYFVSHGGEAFPSVIVVLQGDNVTLEVVSTTFISKSGITSATIKTVPDQPFTSFELTFPEKSFSALAANANLCKPTHTVTTKHTVMKRVKGKTRRVVKKTTKTVTESLKMPTEFIAQNGLQIHESTPIKVTGCPKQKAAAKKAKKQAKAKNKKASR
jgi:hypothetical protein